MNAISKNLSSFKQPRETNHYGSVTISMRHCASANGYIRTALAIFKALTAQERALFSSGDLFPVGDLKRGKPVEFGDFCATGCGSNLGLTHSSNLHLSSAIRR